MTSKVTIEAHCADSKHVVVELHETEKGETFYVENGEKLELYIYDNREVMAKEIEKE